VRGVQPLAWRLTDGRAYRFIPSGDELRIEPGDDAPIVAVLDEAAWRDFVNEIATVAGLVYGGRVAFAAGGYADLERWEPALRALASGRPDLRSAEGRVARRGRRRARPHAYLLVRRADRIAPPVHARGRVRIGEGRLQRRRDRRLVEIVERRQAQAAPDDGRSWWAKRADGSPVLCRLIYLGVVEPAIAALGDDPRIRRLAHSPGDRCASPAIAATASRW
jgi:hypothetical protein